MTSMPTLVQVYGAFHQRTAWNLALGGPVVVCAHSYGAVPVSEGLA